MEDILNSAEKDKDVRVIIITGSGEKSFCAGEDLSELSESGECQTVLEHGFAGITNRLSSKPIICASKNARFGLPEVKVGLIASTGGIVRLARELPRKIAMELCLTGKLIYAEEAKEIGIINYAVEGEELMSKAIELAEAIVKNAPLSLKATKEIMHVANSMSLQDALRFSDVTYKYIEKTDDGKEGPLAFVEKRDPSWTGK